VGLVAVVAGLYFMLDRPAVPPDVVGSAATPPTLSHPRDEACPQVDSAAAASLAPRMLAEADSKRERSPFYAGDGLLAVRTYLRAAACFERGSDAGAAEEARKASRQLEARLSDELRIRHVRLERLLAEHKYTEVKREVRLVHELVEDTSHPYASWL
jgi:hypothetical protein